MVGYAGPDMASSNPGRSRPSELAQLNPDNEYPGYEKIRSRFEEILSLVERPTGDLVPLVAEFSYVNQVIGSVSALHDVYSVFRKPDQPLPGEIVGARYEVATRMRVPSGTAQLTVSIQPANAENGATMLTVSTKVFAEEPLAQEAIASLVDSAHNVSKRAFFAIVSPGTADKSRSSGWFLA